MKVTLTTDHIKLTPFSIFQSAVHWKCLAGTAQHCNMFDSFVDCFNVRDKREIKPFLKQYETIDDERFSWLMNSFGNIPLNQYPMGNIYPLKNLKCTFHGRLVKLCELLHFQ